MRENSEKERKNQKSEPPRDKKEMETEIREIFQYIKKDSSSRF